MKTHLKLILPFLLAAAMARSVAGAEILSVAVFDFDSKDEAVRDFGPKVAALVSANLSADPKLITVERAELQKVLGEQELGLSGTVSPESAAKIGQLTGAKVLVTGRVFKADQKTILVAKIIGTETSRVYGEIVEGGPASDLPDLSADLAKKIAADIAEKGATLTAKVETRDERIARLKKSLGDAARPVVAVAISERHYGPHIIDPAAATEFSVVLQQCGFVLADENSTNRPAIRISGEAFSAFGMRKGNLVSCTARVEIKAHEVATGKILAVDRQTSVAVDLAEQNAAKKALENAADDLAARLLPKLIK